MEIAVARPSSLAKLQTIYTSNLKKVIGLWQAYKNDLLIKLCGIKNPISIIISRFYIMIDNISHKIKDPIETLTNQISTKMPSM
jgi:hypothetical protein